MRLNKRAVTALMLMLCLALALPAGAEEIRSYDKAAGGWQYAVMGVYPYEADGAMREVLWRVLSVENGQALMLADQVLDAHQVINETDQAVIKARTYRRIDSYTDSDLCAWMNSEMVETLFPDEAFRDALVEGEFGKLYCLTTEQFTNASIGFNRSMYGENFPDRKATGTPYYIERGGYVDQSTKTAPYWAATIRGKTGYQLQLVGYNGHLSWGAYTRVNVGVRPALTIDLSQCQITGAGTRAEPFLITVAGKAETEAAPIAEETAAEEAGAPEETEDAPEDDDDAAEQEEPEDEEPAEDESEAEPEQEAEQPEESEQADESEQTDEPEQPEESAAQPEAEKEPPKVMIGGVEVLLGTPAPDLSLEGRETAEPVLPSFLFTPTPAPAVTAEEEPEAPAQEAAEAPAQETAAPKAARSYTADSMVLSFLGDLSIGDASQSRTQPTSLTSVIDENGYDYPFSLLGDYLKEDDYTFANLEVVLTERVALKSDKKYNMIGKPEFVSVLTEGGVDVVNTVNNHCMDFTLTGYEDTLAALDGAGVNHFGSVYPGTDRGSDILGKAEVNGVKIGMVGYSYPQEYDLTRLKKRMQQLRSEGCELIVCSLHWGQEEHLTSQFWQYGFARSLIDAGADIIWGHHPHVVQPIMFYKGKPILFSTGNFIFGTMSDVDPSTGIFQLTYDLTGDKPVLSLLNVVPCQTGKRGDYRPYELTEEADRKACLRKLISKKKIAKLDNLPDSFADTGKVLVLPDGKLKEWKEEQ